MRVFICSAYRGNVDSNLKLARRHARLAALCGHTPIVPHLYFPQFLCDEEPEERKLGISLGIELMLLCEEVWIFGSRISNGMEYEIRQAKRMGIPVRLYDDNEKRIYPETMLLDERVNDEYRNAVYGLRFV